MYIHVQRACIYLYSDLFGTCCRVITDKKGCLIALCVCVGGTGGKYTSMQVF